MGFAQPPPPPYRFTGRLSFVALNTARNIVFKFSSNKCLANLSIIENSNKEIGYSVSDVQTNIDICYMAHQ